MGLGTCEWLSRWEGYMGAVSVLQGIQVGTSPRKEIRWAKNCSQKEPRQPEKGLRRGETGGVWTMPGFQSGEMSRQNTAADLVECCRRSIG